MSIIEYVCSSRVRLAYVRLSTSGSLKVREMFSLVTGLLDRTVCSDVAILFIGADSDSDSISDDALLASAEHITYKQEGKLSDQISGINAFSRSF